MERIIDKYFELGVKSQLMENTGGDGSKSGGLDVYISQRFQKSLEDYKNKVMAIVQKYYKGPKQEQYFNSTWNKFLKRLTSTVNQYNLKYGKLVESQIQERRDEIDVLAHEFMTATWQDIASYVRKNMLDYGKLFGRYKLNLSQVLADTSTGKVPAQTQVQAPQTVIQPQQTPVQQVRQPQRLTEERMRPEPVSEYYR